MLPPMLPRRVQPLAGWSIVVVFALIGAALLATVWTTRASILDASDAVRCGQANAVVQAVRADLANLDGVPTASDLAAILDERRDDGLRYLAMIEGRDRGDRGDRRRERDLDDRSDGRNRVAGRDRAREPVVVLAEAGTAVGAGGANVLAPNRRGSCKIDQAGDRLRMEQRSLRKLKDGGRSPRFLIEVEPVQANELRDASTLTLGVGGLAAIALLGVAFVLIRREARRQADATARERERRLASLGEMSAVLAHEIKNPLASLKGNAQLLARMLPPGEKPRAKADRVVDEAMRLEQLTNDLLQFVRTGTIQRTPVDPAALVREAATSIAGDITIEADGAPAQWSLDAGRIRQVVVNLLDNAVAAGPPVTVRVRRDRGALIIEVTDHGPGVAEDDRDKIFEPFFTGKTQGTGLGLAVVRRVVELHRGTIAVLPTPGGGATFRAEIPET